MFWSESIINDDDERFLFKCFEELVKKHWKIDDNNNDDDVIFWLYTHNYTISLYNYLSFSNVKMENIFT